ncbi:uncharacterized protein LOC101863262 [Aplysia californica]|uniref:Uncharacterized protein LOC101863262 n=1 Tax=Aplysia californica TaxID=6500 RepID=A0ABM0JMQ9_APLCA|nr:uncharacterized protein LOC101863262 [Aplysia californica]
MTSLDLPGPAVTAVLGLVCALMAVAEAIDCYKCTSINGKNEGCEDKFDTGISTVELIARNCVYGFFKGTHCIKLKGEKEDGTRITVRDCSDGDWGSHCGDIRYVYGNQEQKIYGCLEACDQDGCNSAISLRPSFVVVTLLVSISIVLLTRLQSPSLLSERGAHSSSS